MHACRSYNLHGTFHSLRDYGKNLIERGLNPTLLLESVNLLHRVIHNIDFMFDIYLSLYMLT